MVRPMVFALFKMSDVNVLMNACALTLLTSTLNSFINLTTWLNGMDITSISPLVWMRKTAKKSRLHVWMARCCAVYPNNYTSAFDLADLSIVGMNGSRNSTASSSPHGFCEAFSSEIRMQS